VKDRILIVVVNSARGCSFQAKAILINEISSSIPVLACLKLFEARCLKVDKRQMASWKGVCSLGGKYGELGMN